MYLEQIQSFCESEENILLLFGKGGNGKSHILSEIDSLPLDQFKLIFIQPSIRDFKDAFQDELSLEERYIFVFDDADRYIEEIPLIISLIKSKQNNYKLILTSRLSGKNSIDKIIYENRLEDITIQIHLPDWKTQELVKLLDIMEVNLDKDEKNLIARKYPNPYLITWIGKQYKGEDTISIERIREKFIGDIKREVEQELKNILQYPFEFLIDLTVIVPFNLNDGKLINNLKARYFISAENIKSIFQLPIDCGILRRVGETARFDPDMRGDLLLYYYLENEGDEKKSLELFEFWLNIFPEKVFLNIQSLSRYFSSSSIKDFCSVEVNKWIDEAEKTNGWNRISDLNLLSYIAHLIPEQAINLLYTYLATPSAAVEENLIYNFEPSTDDYGLILISLMWFPEWRDRILDIIEILLNMKIGTYDNFKLNRLIQSLVSPLNHKTDYIIKTLENIDVWLQKPDIHKCELIESALIEVLSSAHEVIESYGYMIKIFELPLKLTEEIVKMRKKALQLLIKLINSSEEFLILMALRISRQIGDSKMRRISIDEIPLKEEIIEERKSIVEAIGELTKNDIPLKILEKIEDLFLHWFAAETLGTEGVVNYLLSFPRTIEYIVFKSFVEPHFLIIDFQEIVNSAPIENKWDWMFENHYNKDIRINDPLYSRLAQELESRYSTSESTFTYLKDLDNILTPLSPWNHPLIVTEWIKINRNKFLFIKSKNELWNNLPHRFKNEIEIELSKQNEEYLEKLAEEIFSNVIDLNRIRTFLSILQMTKISEEKLNIWISKLIEIEDLEVLDELSYSLWNIFNKYDLCEKLTEICITLISPFDTKKRSIFSRLDFSFDLIRKSRTKIEQQTLSTLANISSEYLKSLSHLDYKHESILFLTFKDRIPAFIDFLVYRFEMEKTDYRNYQSVPQGGFHKLKYLFDSREKFELFVNGLEKINEEISLGGLRLSDLNNNVISLYNKETDKQYFVEYIEKLIKEGDIIRAIKFLPFIDDKEKNLLLVFNVAEKGIANGYKDKVINAYYSFENSSFCWGTKELEKRKDFFTKLKQISKPGLHAKIIQDQTEYLEQNIKSLNRNDQEFYTPRG